MTITTLADLLDPYVDMRVGGTLDTRVARSDWLAVCGQLALYLELILRWNTRINLTAIREPEEIVRRHFGESLFVAARLGPCPTLLDFGSGAGLPGIPIQLMRSDIKVTLAESRNRKAAFLREAIRVLGLLTEVWGDRVEAMPLTRQFHTVALRAVDKMDGAVREAALRATDRVMILGTSRSAMYAGLKVENFSIAEPVALPDSPTRVMFVAHRR